MEISVGLALLLAFVAGFAYYARRFMGAPFIERAIIMAPITGLIMGDLKTGLIIGGTLELIFMGATAIGGSVPPNIPVGAVLGTAFAISAGLSIEEALVIAVPAALLGSLCELLAKTVSTIFVNAAEKYAEKGNSRGISTMVHLGNIAHGLSTAIPVFVALVLGQNAVAAASSALPESIRTGITVAGKILPALGFGILLSTLASPSFIPWFFIGFAIAAYAGWGVLGVSFVGIMGAAFYIAQKGGLSSLTSSAKGKVDQYSVVPKKDQIQMFWRSFALQSAFSFDRMQALGFTWTLMPFLEKIYKNSKEFAASLKRHLSFFNTNPWVVGPVVAIVAELESKRAENPEEVDEQSIQAVKGSLMGPLAGIGDSMIQGTLVPIMGGVASSLALQGNPIAPILFFLVINVAHFWVRWNTLSVSFKFGTRFFEEIDQSSMSRLLEGATIAGLMGVGGLVGTWLNIKTPVVYAIGDASITLQTMLDSIMPKLLPLIATLAVYLGIKKGLKNTQVLLIILIVGGVLGALKILG